ncbi:hypothetical protein [Haladaptatus sp. DYF46]|uniref:hypothetical protein n=1 Tax=Haladaptatus sp. DYF46 TaxID=2886041 RepID=UPI001E299C75|nr:hypothetical protein [Haladaptatus sp. DYF46]
MAAVITKPVQWTGFESLKRFGHYVQLAEGILLELGGVAFTGGLDKVILYVIKKMAKNVWKCLDKEYSIKENAANLGEKVVNWVKSQRNPNLFSLPTTR